LKKSCFGKHQDHLEGRPEVGDQALDEQAAELSMNPAIQCAAHGLPQGVWSVWLLQEHRS
jgi:hypothetical protein